MGASVLRQFTIKKTACALLPAVFFLSALSPLPACAGWTQAAGEWYTNQQFIYYQTDTFVDDGGLRLKQPDFRKYSWNSYAEYGLTDDTTAGFSLLLDHLEADYQFFAPGSPALLEGTRSNGGLSDSEIFLRHKLKDMRLWRRDVALSAQTTLKFPTWYNDGQPPQSGTDDFDAELRLQAGFTRTKGQLKHFGKMEAAYRKRFGEWRDQWRFDATYGYDLGGGLVLLPQAFITYRAEGTAITNPALGAASDFDLVKTQLSLLYALDEKTQMQFGAFYDLHVRNTSEGEGLFISFSRRF